MMKKFIIKSNEWYDNLPEPKRTLFFLIVIMGSLILCQILMYGLEYKWPFVIWALILVSWRSGYSFIKAYELYKKQKVNKQL